CRPSQHTAADLYNTQLQTFTTQKVMLVSPNLSLLLSLRIIESLCCHLVFSRGV
ncbi:unnamed protein product, partial [Candidula unifasciata]